MEGENEKLLWAAFQHCSSLPTSNTPEKNIYSQTHTYTQKQLLPKSLLYVGSVYVFIRVCVCVWALLCLQDAQRRTGSLKSFGYKVKRARRAMETKRREQERERDRKEKKEQDTTTSTKGGQAQQSVANSHFICVMLTVPSSYPLSRGKLRRGRESLHSDTDVAPFVVILFTFFSLLALFRNNILEWRTILS